MFALIHNNVIKVGPRNWSYWIFRKYLEENLLSYLELPHLYSNPIITETWKLLPIAQLDSPAHDPLFEQYAGPYWDIYDDYINGHYDVVDKPIDLIKGHMKDVIAQNRYNTEIQGFTHTFPDETSIEIYTDRENRGVYLDALLIMGETDTIDFKFKNSQFKKINKSELYSIVNVGSTHIKEVFNWESMKTSEIDNAQTITELKLIQLTHPTQIINN